jgi:hypothetical protein
MNDKEIMELTIQEAIKQLKSLTNASKLIENIGYQFEALLDNIFIETDYKDDDGYKVRRVENISAQLIEDVQDTIKELNMIRRLNG